MRPKAILRLTGLPLFVLTATLGAEPSGNISLTRTDDRVRVEISAKLFTEYKIKGGRKPYFHPVLAPDGTELTIEGQGDNHQHHHGLWFTHGDVNGVIF